MIETSPSPISDKTNKYLHSKLPIEDTEKILGVYRHHWFAYASIWIVGFVVIIAVMSIAGFLVGTSSGAGSIDQHKSAIIAGAIIFSAVIALFSIIPVWLKSQEQIVLTEEALLQILQPSLFTSKVSQLSLQHVADVSVRQDFFGSMFGFGEISIETPGEQDNYEFYQLPDPQNTAKAIIEAHENFTAALESGRMVTTLGTPQVQAPQIDPQQFQEFLAFQQAEQAMAAQNLATTGRLQQASAQPQDSASGPSESDVAVPPYGASVQAQSQAQSQQDSTWLRPSTVPTDTAQAQTEATELNQTTSTSQQPPR